MLGPGWFQNLQNLRCDTGLPVGRNTDLSIRTKPSWATSAVPLGCKSVSVNGAQYELAVFSDGTKARIAVAPSALDRWVEVTGAGQWTGPSGNNRLDSLTAHCQIAAIRTPRQRTTAGTFASRDVVLIQNGEDYPRLWDPGSLEKVDHTVTAVTTNGGLFRLTIGAHNIQVNDHVYVSGVGGLPQLDGIWQVSAVSATQVTLLGSTFAAGFTSGGTVTDRADVLVHKPIEDVTATGESFAGVDSFAPIAGGASTTYGTGGVVNQARYAFADSATAPYTGTNSVIDWDITTGTAAAGDIAHVNFTTPITLGQQLIMLVEGASVLSALKQAKIEFNTENVAYAAIVVAWVTALDPTGSDATKKQFQSITENSTANRYWVIIDTGQLAGSICYHMRFTRQGSAPGATQQNYILFMGAVTGDIPASTQWGFHFEDALNQVEQHFHVMSALSDNVGALGGPQSVTTGTANIDTAAPSLPLVDTMVADFHFTLKQPTTAGPIDGGLNGVPEKVAVYGQLPGQEVYYWLFSGAFYDAGYNAGVRSWSKNSSDLVVDIGLPSSVTQDIFNYNREAPSAFHSPIPIAAVSEYLNQRLFAGAIKDATGQYAYGDYYYSWDRNPFRFQQVQEDEFRGGYGQIAGERIMAFRLSASGALGSGRVFMFSDQWLYSMGESGPFSDAGLPASEIGRPVRIGPHGTLSPRAPAVAYGALLWPDQDGQIMRLGNGGIQNISRGQVDDRLDAMVASRKANVSGVFWKDRYYLAYTPSGETTNEKVLVWNERMQAWESEDDDEGATNFELLHVWPTTPGVIYASRLFFFDTVGTLFGYEETTSGSVAVRWTTGAYNFKSWTSWYITKAIMAATSQSATGTLSRISSKWGTTEPWSTTISYNESGAVIATYLDSVAHSKTGTERTELDWEWYLDYTATVTPGTTIRRLEFEAQESNVTAGLGTA
jgi:hypothetical protein